MSHLAGIHPVFFGRHVSTPTTHRRITAGEDEPAQAGVCGHIEDVAQACHIGAKQRGGIAQPGAGVDHTVVDVVAAGHRLGHGGGVEDVAVESGER